MSAPRLVALALLALSLPASAGRSSSGPTPGDWVITYDYTSSTLDSMSPYWEATLDPNGDLELTLLAFPMFGAYLPTSVWGDWDTRRRGRTLRLYPDAYTELEGQSVGGGCYAGTITYTDSQGSMTGVWEGCPLP